MTKDVAKPDTVADKDKASGQDQEKEVLPTDSEKEVGGRNGPEPTRYGDWEKNGLISDF